MGSRKKQNQKKEAKPPEEKPKPRQLSLFESSKRSAVTQNTCPKVMKVKNMKKLAEFDANIRYGPWLGISRTVRYKRAVRLGLNPPIEIGKLLDEVKFQEVETDESTYESSMYILSFLFMI